jgi:cysteine sulfinate desulfinase/cysteine desulfurase-like protein
MGFSETESNRLLRVSSYLEQTEEDWRSLASAFLEARDQLESESAQSTVISL